MKLRSFYKIQEQTFCSICQINSENKEYCHNCYTPIMITWHSRPATTLFYVLFLLDPGHGMMICRSVKVIIRSILILFVSLLVNLFSSEFASLARLRMPTCWLRNACLPKIYHFSARFARVSTC